MSARIRIALAMYDDNVVTCCCFICSPSSENVYIYKRWGAHERLVRGEDMPSISCVLPCAVNACAMSLQSRQEKFTVDTKSKYNVFVCVELTVEFAVDSTTDDQIKAAHYKLASPQMQVQSYVQDIVRT